MAEEKKDVRPLLVLNRTYTLVSKYGHAVKFEKDVPTRIPPVMLAEAAAIGAIPADGSNPDILEEEVKKTTPLTNEQRAEKIMEAIKAIVAKNDVNEFTGGGLPHHKTVSVLTGFKVDSKEVRAVWQTYCDQKQEAEQAA